MQIKITNSAHYPIWIDSYHNGKITIDNTVYDHSIAIKEQDIVPINIEFNELTLNDLLPKTSPYPTIIILGTGNEHLFLPSQLQVECYQSGLKIEVMNTSSAVHTFNLLIADHRNAWAWLWLP